MSGSFSAQDNGKLLLKRYREEKSKLDFNESYLSDQAISDGSLLALRIGTYKYTAENENAGDPIDLIRMVLSQLQNLKFENDNNDLIEKIKVMLESAEEQLEFFHENSLKIETDGQDSNVSSGRKKHLSIMMENQLDLNESEMGYYEEVINELTEKLEKTKEEKEDLQDICSSLGEKLHKITYEKEDLIRLKTEIEEESKKKSNQQIEFNMKLKELEIINSDLQNKYFELKNSNISYENDLQSLLLKVSLMEKDILEKDIEISNFDKILIEKNQLIENYETNLITINLKMNESENKIQNLLHQTNQEVMTQEDFDFEIENLKDRINIKQKRIDDLNIENERLKSELDLISSQLSQFQFSDFKNDADSKIKLLESDTQIELLKSEINSYKVEFQNQSELLGLKDDEIKNLTENNEYLKVLVAKLTEKDETNELCFEELRINFDNLQSTCEKKSAIEVSLAKILSALQLIQCQKNEIKSGFDEFQGRVTFDFAEIGSKFKFLNEFFNDLKTENLNLQSILQEKEKQINSLEFTDFDNVKENSLGFHTEFKIKNLLHDFEIYVINILRSLEATSYSKISDLIDKIYLLENQLTVISKTLNFFQNKFISHEKLSIEMKETENALKQSLNYIEETESKIRHLEDNLESKEYENHSLKHRISLLESNFIENNIQEAHEIDNSSEKSLPEEIGVTGAKVYAQNTRILAFLEGECLRLKKIADHYRILNSKLVSDSKNTVLFDMKYKKIEKLYNSSLENEKALLKKIKYLEEMISGKSSEFNFNLNSIQLKESERYMALLEKLQESDLKIANLEKDLNQERQGNLGFLEKYSAIQNEFEILLSQERKKTEQQELEIANLIRKNRDQSIEISHVTDLISERDLKLDSFNHQITFLEEELNTLKKTNSIQLNDLNLDVNEKSNKLSLLETEIVIYKDRLSELEHEKVLYDENLSSNITKRSELERELLEISNSLQLKNDDYVLLNQKFQSTLHENTILAEDLQLVNSMLKEKEESNLLLREDITEKEKIIFNLEQTINFNTTSIEKLSHQLNEINLSFSQLDNSYQDLQTRFLHIQSEEQLLRATLESKLLEHQVLDNQINQLLSTLQSTQQEKSQLIDDLQSSQLTIKLYEEGKESGLTEFSLLSQTNNTLNQYLNELISFFKTFFTAIDMIIKNISNQELLSLHQKEIDFTLSNSIEFLAHSIQNSLYNIEDIKVLESKLLNYPKFIDELAKNLSSKNNENLSLTTEIKNSKLMNEKYLIEIEKLSENLILTNDKFNQAIELSDGFQKENEHLRNKLSDHTSQIYSFISEELVFSQEISSYLLEFSDSIKIDEFKSKNDLINQIHSLSSVSDIPQVLSEYALNNRSLFSRMKYLLDSTRTNLSIQLELISSQKSEYDSFSENLTENLQKAENQIAKLESDLNQNKTEFDSLISQYQKLENQHIELEVILQTQYQKNQILEQELSNLSEVNFELKEAIKQHESKYLEAKNINKSLLSKINELESKLNESISGSEILRKKMLDNNIQVEKMTSLVKKLKSEKEALDDVRKSLESDLDRTRFELSKTLRIENKNELNEDFISDVEKSLNSLQAVVELIETELIESFPKSSVLEIPNSLHKKYIDSESNSQTFIASHFNSTLTKLSKIKMAIREASKEKSLQDNKMQILNAEINNMQNLVNNYKSQLEQIFESKESLALELNSSSKFSNELNMKLNEYKIEIARLNSANLKLENEKTSKLNEIEGLNESLKLLQNELTSSKSLLFDRDQSIRKLQEEISKEVTMTQNNALECDQYLRQLENLKSDHQKASITIQKLESLLASEKNSKYNLEKKMNDYDSKLVEYHSIETELSLLRKDIDNYKIANKELIETKLNFEKTFTILEKELKSAQNQNLSLEQRINVILNEKKNYLDEITETKLKIQTLKESYENEKTQRLRIEANADALKKAQTFENRNLSQVDDIILSGFESRRLKDEEEIRKLRNSIQSFKEENSKLRESILLIESEKFRSEKELNSLKSLNISLTKDLKVMHDYQSSLREEGRSCRKQILELFASLKEIYSFFMLDLHLMNGDSNIESLKTEMTAPLMIYEDNSCLKLNEALGLSELSCFAQLFKEEFSKYRSEFKKFKSLQPLIDSIKDENRSLLAKLEKSEFLKKTIESEYQKEIEEINRKFQNIQASTSDNFSLLQQVKDFESLLSKEKQISEKYLTEISNLKNIVKDLKQTKSLKPIDLALTRDPEIQKELDKYKNENKMMLMELDKLKAQNNNLKNIVDKVEIASISITKKESKRSDYSNQQFNNLEYEIHRLSLHIKSLEELCSIFKAGLIVAYTNQEIFSNDHVNLHLSRFRIAEDAMESIQKYYQEDIKSLEMYSDELFYRFKEKEKYCLELQKQYEDHIKSIYRASKDETSEFLKLQLEQLKRDNEKSIRLITNQRNEIDNLRSKSTTKLNTLAKKLISYYKIRNTTILALKTIERQCRELGYNINNNEIFNNLEAELEREFSIDIIEDPPLNKSTHVKVSQLKNSHHYDDNHGIETFLKSNVDQSLLSSQKNTHQNISSSYNLKTLDRSTGSSSLRINKAF